MLSDRNSSLIPAAGIIGFIGIALMGVKFSYGLIVVLIALGIFAFGFFRGRNGDLPLPHQIPAMNTIVSEFEMTQDPKGRLPQPVGDNNSLLTALRTQGFNLKAPVILTDGDPVTAEDLFLEIAAILKEQGKTVDQMKPLLPAMYDILWDYTEEATKLYSDLGMIKTHIASSVYFKATFDQPALE